MRAHNSSLPDDTAQAFRQTRYESRGRERRPVVFNRPRAHVATYRERTLDGRRPGAENERLELDATLHLHSSCVQSKPNVKETKRVLGERIGKIQRIRIVVAVPVVYRHGMDMMAEEKKRSGTHSSSVGLV